MDDLSVGLSVCPSVCLSGALWQNGRLDPDYRLDGSRDEAGVGVWRSVHGKGYFWGRIMGVLLSTGTYRAYVCYIATMRPFCQITLGRLVILLLQFVAFIMLLSIVDRF